MRWASQQDEQRLVDIILANVGTVICFRSGSPADERLILPLFIPYIEQGEIANLPAYNFYARIAAVQAQEPLSGGTVLLKNEGSDKIARAVVEHSRREYGVMKTVKQELIPQVVEAVQTQSTKKIKNESKSETNKIQNAVPTT